MLSRRDQFFASLFEKETMRKMYPHRDSALRAYLRDIGGLPPPLSAADEARVLLHAVQGDPHAQHQLVEANLRMVIIIAARFQDRGIPLMDLIQEGNLGLYDAIKHFDLSRKNRFGAYAKYHIVKRIGRAIGERAKVIHTPYSTAQRMQKVAQAVSELLDQGIHPTTELIAQRMKLPLEQVAEALALSQEPLSLNRAEGDHDPVGNMIAAPPLLLSNEVSSPALLADVKRMIEDVLPEDERQVIELRFGLNEEGVVYDHLEIAQKLFGRTGPRADERMRQLERSGLAKLRAALERKEVDPCVPS